MAKKRRRKSRRPETVSSTIKITEIDPRVRFTMRDPSGQEPEVDTHAGLELRGTMSEPVRDVSEVSIRVWADWNHTVGPNRPAYVGYITHTRPVVSVISGLPLASFEYLWSLALSGQLKHAYVLFTKTHYGSASVISMSFSREIEE